MGGTQSAPALRQRVSQLAHGEPAEDAAFWRPVFLADVSLDEVCEELAMHDVRRMRWKHPHNLALLCFKCLEQLRHFLKLNEDKKRIAHDFRSARNSLRMLTRLMPLCHERDPPQPVEDPQEGAAEFAELFWVRNSRLLPGCPGERFAQIAGEPLAGPLYSVLADTLLSIAAVPNFCIPERPAGAAAAQTPEEGSVDPTLLWYPGVGPATANANWAELDQGRLDLVLCVLSCCTAPVYGTDPLQPNLFLDSFSGGRDRRRLTMVHSLLNCVVSYDPRGSLPYTSYYTDAREPLLTAAIHLLLVGLDCSLLYRAVPAAAGAPVASPRSGVAAAAAAAAEQQSAFWAVVGGLSAEADMTAVFNAVLVLLRNPVDAQSTWLPGSQKALPCAKEVLCLLWKLVESNRKFRQHCSKVLDVAGLVVPLLHIMDQSKGSETEAGTFQVALWTLLLLSGERDFAVALNRPFSENTPFALPIFQGNYIDVIVIMFHQFVAFDQVDWVRLLVDRLLTVMTNLSPFTKTLSMVASVKLVNLFDGMTTRAYLTKCERNWQNVQLLLEAFNNLVQYQYEGNVPLVYAILRRKSAFDRLATLLGDDPAERIDAPWRGELRMHTHTAQRMLSVLHPEVERFCAAANQQEEEVVRFLGSATLVGLLPQPHSLMKRAFVSTAPIHAHVQTWTWSVICTRQRVPPLFDPRTIQLFPVQGQDGQLNPVASRPARVQSPAAAAANPPGPPPPAAAAAAAAAVQAPPAAAPRAAPAAAAAPPSAPPAAAQEAAVRSDGRRVVSM